ncbi:hypothetical protein H7Y63_03260 [Polaromonas sp.]|nr:hypothetical protein [Candidatus Saccharibacteria bacterium]
MLYLNEPAPAVNSLHINSQRTVVVFCNDCKLPVTSSAKVIRSTDPAIADQYGLLRSDGLVGPGYAVITSTGVVRYRTFDPAPGQHSGEIDRLVRTLP